VVSKKAKLFIPACRRQVCLSALICGLFYPRPSAQSLPSRQAGASSLPAERSQEGAFYIRWFKSSECLGLKGLDNKTMGAAHRH
jgi:hypothetical protein